MGYGSVEQQEPSARAEVDAVAPSLPRVKALAVALAVVAAALVVVGAFQVAAPRTVELQSSDAQAFLYHSDATASSKQFVLECWDGLKVASEHSLPCQKEVKKLMKAHYYKKH
mmetsp:Transcript_43391/g.67964  ORF Transcript_43391/g.67964 Transcript_43391/m.67964 type:complete len:113 (+) Transcript_43391:55-393(+)